MNTAPRIVFWGTPAPAACVLDALLRQGSVIVGVVTQPDKPAGRHQKLTPPPVKSLAQHAPLPVIQPLSLRAPGVQTQLDAWQPAVSLVVAYGKIIPAAMLEKSGPFINVHFSLLPAYRGAAPVQRALMDGVTETGVTLQYLAPELDAGDIIAQARVAVREDDTTATLMEHCLAAAIPLVQAVMPRVADGTAPRMPQDHARATLAPKLQKSEGALRWTDTAVALHNRVRACNPWPGAIAWLHGQPLKIWRSRVAEAGASAAPPGALIPCPNRLLVATHAGTLELLDVQPPGKGRMSAAAFLAGRSLPPAFDVTPPMP